MRDEGNEFEQDPDERGDGATSDGWDLADVLWLPGVDYVRAWRVAKREADGLNVVFAAAGLAREHARAVAVSGADGSASVEIRASAAGARRIAGLLSAARRGGAPRQGE